MPSGTGAVNVKNVPQQAYRVDPTYFNANTERNIYNPHAGDPVPVNPAAGGSPLKYHQTLDKVGIVPLITVLLQYNLVTTVGGGALSTGYRWPWGLNRYQVSGNGSTDFINVDGFFLFLRDVVTNPGSVPLRSDYAVTVATAGTYPITLAVNLPVAMDMVSLTGALYAQARGTSVAVDIPANPTNDLGLLTVPGTSTAVMSSNGGVTLGEEFYSVPYDQTKNQIVVPDIELLHGFTDNQQSTASGNSAAIDLQPFVGQLERIFWYWDNNGALVPSSAYTNIQFQYGGTQQPLTWTGPQLRRRMNQEIRSDPNTPVIPDGAFVIDFVRWTPSRDVILMDGVASPRLQLNVTGVTWAGSPTVHYAVENLFV